MGTIERALGLLDHLSVASPELGLTEFQKRSGFDKATTHRYLTSLTRQGFLEQDPVTRNYRLGVAFLRYSALREATFPLKSAISPVIDGMSDRLRELVHCSMFDGSALRVIYFSDRDPHGVRVTFDYNEVMAVHATSSGHAVLAFSGEATLAGLLNSPLEGITRRTMTDPDQLRERLRFVKAQGYATTSETMEVGVSSLAVPVFNSLGTVWGAVAVAFPTSRETEALRTAILSELKACGPEITARLGGTVPDDLKERWAA